MLHGVVEFFLEAQKELQLDHPVGGTETVVDLQTRQTDPSFTKALGDLPTSLCKATSSEHRDLPWIEATSLQNRTADTSSQVVLFLPASVSALAPGSQDAHRLANRTHPKPWAPLFFLPIASHMLFLNSRSD
jgi:hypothetical protein